MVNGNQSKRLGLGAVVGLGMEENERENVPLISVENRSQACRYCGCGGRQQRQQADISEKARRLMFRDPSTKPWLFLLDK